MDEEQAYPSFYIPGGANPVSLSCGGPSRPVEESEEVRAPSYWSYCL